VESVSSERARERVGVREGEKETELQGVVDVGVLRWW